MSPSLLRIAHRGASGLYPENTLLAYRRAIELGVDMLEVDVHLSRDGELVIIHDSHLERTTNGQGRVRDFPLAQLQALDAGQGERIPSLTETLHLAQSAAVRLCVEIKGAAEVEELEIAEATVRALEQADFVGQVVVTSFSPGALRRVKMLQPRFATLLDPSPQDGSLTPRQICEQALLAGANCLSYDFQFVTQAVMDECWRTGLVMWPWAPNTPTEIRAMLQLGVPGIMTDRPDVLNAVLKENHHAA